jgi:hypothetical protein
MVTRLEIIFILVKNFRGLTDGFVFGIAEHPREFRITQNESPFHIGH